LTQLQDFLHANNAYFLLFKTALERVPTDDNKVVIRADKTHTVEHPRRFNAPTPDVVAIVMVGNDFGTRDIVIQKINNTLQHVAESRRSYDALQYPLIFWQGEDGYHFQIPQTSIRRQLRHRKKGYSNGLLCLPNYDTCWRGQSPTEVQGAFLVSSLLTCMRR
jgi:hypothetical protein